MKIFLVCFGDISDSPLGEILRRCPEAQAETRDGGQAYSRIMRLVPDLVVLDGDRKPNHVLQTLRPLVGARRLGETRFLILAGREVADQFLPLGDKVELVRPDRVTEIIGELTKAGS